MIEGHRSDGGSGVCDQQVERIKSLLHQLKHIQAKPTGVPDWEKEASVQLTGELTQAEDTEVERLTDELEIQIEDAKKRAMDLFEEERYRECDELFGFLCGLEPENHTLRDYLMLSRQMVQEQEAAQQQESKETLTELPEITIPVGTAAETQASGALMLENSRETIAEFQGPTLQIPGPRLIDANSLSESSQDKINKIEGQIKLSAAWSRRRNQFALALVVIALLLTAVLEGLISHFRSTHPTEMSQVQNPTLLSEERKNADDARLKPGSIVDRRDPRDLNEGSNIAIAEENNSPTIAAHTLNKVACKARVFQGDSNRNSMPKEEPTAESTSKSLENKPTVTSEGIHSSSPGGKRIPKQVPESGLTYPVIHDHFIGSCRGKLTLRRTSISFSPLKRTKHTFDLGLTEIVDTELGESLKIKTRDKTYRFKGPPNGPVEGNRAGITAIYLQLVNLKTSSP